MTASIPATHETGDAADSGLLSPDGDMATKLAGRIDDDRKADSRAWWMVTVLLVLYILSTVDRSIIAMMVDPIKADLGLSDFRMGLVLGPAFGVLYTVFGVASGWITDRWSRRWLIFVGVILWSCTTMGSGLATSFLGLFVMRALVAVGEATLTPAAYSMISDRFPKRRLTTAMAVYTMGPKAGQSVALAAGGFAIAFAGTLSLAGTFYAGMKPWHLVFLMAGAPGLVAAFLIFTVSEPARYKPALSKEGTGELGLIAFLRTRPKLFATLFIGFCFIALPAGALPAWLPTFMERQFHWTPVKYGSALGLVSLLSAITLLPKGMLVDWLYSRGIRDASLRFFTWLLIIFTPVGAATFFLKSPPLFLICVGIVQVVSLPFMLYANATLQMITPGNLRGRMTATFMVIIPLFSQSIGVPLVGILNDFVFRDPGRIGLSLAIITVVGMLGAFVALRLALRLIEPALLDQDECLARVA